MGARSFCSSSSFVRESIGWERKKPLLADNGEGCADSMMATSERPDCSMGARFLAIPAPQYCHKRLISVDECRDRGFGDGPPSRVCGGMQVRPWTP